MQPRRLIALIALFTAVSMAMPVMADDTITKQHQEREAFAKDFAQAVITILHDHKKAYGDRKDILRRAFSDSVDINWIAKFVLGRAWKDATGQQRDYYTLLYRKFLTETYVTQFAESPRQSIYSIKILAVNDDENNEFIVRTQMQLMNQANLKVDYRVCDEDGHYKVLDIIIENVSLITTHRTEFAALATQQGVDGVIKKLEQNLGQGKLVLSMNQ